MSYSHCIAHLNFVSLSMSNCTENEFLCIWYKPHGHFEQNNKWENFLFCISLFYCLFFIIYLLDSKEFQLHGVKTTFHLSTMLVACSHFVSSLYYSLPDYWNSLEIASYTKTCEWFNFAAALMYSKHAFGVGWCIVVFKPDWGHLWEFSHCAEFLQMTLAITCKCAYDSL